MSMSHKIQQVLFQNSHLSRQVSIIVIRPALACKFVPEESVVDSQSQQVAIQKVRSLCRMSLAHHQVSDCVVCSSNKGENRNNPSPSQLPRPAPSLFCIYAEYLADKQQITTFLVYVVTLSWTQTTDMCPSLHSECTAN